MKKKIFTGDHPAQAYFVLGLLHSHGIEAHVLQVELFSAQGVLPVPGCAQPEVWLLDEQDEERALTVLNKAPIIAACWHCPHCGEMLEPQFTDCWHCAGEPAQAGGE